MNINHAAAKTLSESAEGHMREAVRLYEAALPFEERASESVPDDQPRTKRILRSSADAIRFKMDTLRSMLR